MAASRSWRPIDLIAHLGQFLTDRVRPDERLCVGLSGGRDSVVLLHAVAQLKLANPLRALHVHHGLSPHADAWAEHCSRLCAALGLDCSLLRVQVERDAGLGLEGAARKARYQAFVMCDADVLLLAHHQGDQAETLLFNLLRGCGVTGAAAMPQERLLGRLRLLRPLLEVAPTELEAYGRAHDLVWVEDESNADLSLSRNYLRHEILASLSERFPGMQHALGQAAGHFAEAERLLGELAESDWLRCSDGQCLRLSKARLLSDERLKNLLRWRLRQRNWRVPVAARLNEFVRQLRSAGPDRHPALPLPEGVMRVKRGLLFWDETPLKS